MRAAIITDGIVTDLLTVASMEHYEGCVEAPDDAQIGWTFNGTTFLPPPTDPAKVERDMAQVIQEQLDATAQSLGYDGILSAVSYAPSTHPKFGHEGRAMLAWRDACWSYGYDVLYQVKAGQRAIPSPEELIAGLPPFTLG